MFVICPALVHVAGTSTLRLPAGISEYSSVAKYTLSPAVTLVPLGIPIADVLFDFIANLIVVVDPAAGFL